MTTKNQVGSHFVVDLGSIKLSPLQEQKLGAQIQASVLGALAESDFGGNFNSSLLGPDWLHNATQTLGFILKNPGSAIPMVAQSVPPSVPESDLLVVADHTLIMTAIMEHPFQVVDQLPEEFQVKGGKPTGADVLKAALKVKQIGADVKLRISKVLEVYPLIENVLSSAPAAFNGASDDIKQNVVGKDIEEQAVLLRDPAFRKKHQKHGFADGMEIAAQMLEDGKDSIYSPDFSFYQMLQVGTTQSSAIAPLDARGVIGTIGSTDTIGAVAGGAAGSVIPGAGTTAGGVVGGLIGSAAGAIGEFISWWRS